MKEARHKGLILNDSIYRMYPEGANPESSDGQGTRGGDQGEAANRDTVTSQCLKSAVVTVVQL